MKEHITDLLKPLIRRQIVSEHYRKKHHQDLPDLSEDELDDEIDAKIASIDLNGIINGVDYISDLDTSDTISVVTMSLNTKQTKSII